MIKSEIEIYCPIFYAAHFVVVKCIRLEKKELTTTKVLLTKILALECTAES